MISILFYRDLLFISLWWPYRIIFHDVYHDTDGYAGLKSESFEDCTSIILLHYSQPTRVSNVL